jgi:hypothetical protein
VPVCLWLLLSFCLLSACAAARSCVVIEFSAFVGDWSNCRSGRRYLLTGVESSLQLAVYSLELSRPRCNLFQYNARLSATIERNCDKCPANSYRLCMYLPHRRQFANALLRRLDRLWCPRTNSEQSIIFQPGSRKLWTVHGNNNSRQNRLVGLRLFRNSG